MPYACRKSYNGFLQAIIPQAHIGRVNALLAQPAGDQFWSGGDDGWIRLWQVRLVVRFWSASQSNCCLLILIRHFQNRN